MPKRGDHRRRAAATCSPDIGQGPAVTTDDVVGPAMEAEAIFGASSCAPPRRPLSSGWPSSSPRTLAIMHGSSYRGDGADALRRLAAAYDDQYLHPTH